MQIMLLQAPSTITERFVRADFLETARCVRELGGGSICGTRLADHSEPLAVVKVHMPDNDTT